MAEDRMLKWFEYEHLPEHLQGVSAPFCALAYSVVQTIECGPERTVALRKLLEAKDAAVRAMVHPGGWIGDHLLEHLGRCRSVCVLAIFRHPRSPVSIWTRRFGGSRICFRAFCLICVRAVLW